MDTSVRGGADNVMRDTLAGQSVQLIMAPTNTEVVVGVRALECLSLKSSEG